jgi:hypothetical protein
MKNTLRTRIARLAIAAATLGSVVAGAISLAPSGAAAAPANQFKADMSVKPAFQVPIGGSVMYYFQIANTGLDSGAVENPQYICGVNTHFKGESQTFYTYHFGLGLPSTWVVNAGQTKYLVAQCNAYSPEDQIVGVHLFGELENNIGDSSFSVTVGYVP